MIDLKKYTAISYLVKPIGTFLTFILGLIIGVIAQDWWTKQYVNNPTLAFFVIAIILSILVFLFIEFYRLLSSLYDKVGIKVRYVENDETAQIYRACNKIISNASKSIYTVNSYITERHEPKGNSTQKKLVHDERKKYYDLLLKKGKEDKIDYVRIIQTKPNNEPLAEREVDPLHFDHLLNMIACKKNDRYCSTVNLIKAEHSRVNTYILVDNVHLIWQINEVVFDLGDPNGKLNIQGAFIFHDPQKRITEQFLKFFDILRNNPNIAITAQNGILL